MLLFNNFTVQILGIWYHKVKYYVNKSKFLRIVIICNNWRPMLSEIQSRQVKKFKKFARKNKLCKCIATVIIIILILVGDFIRSHKRRMIKLVQLAVICAAFLCNTSFVPPLFPKMTAVKMDEIVKEKEQNLPEETEVMSSEDTGEIAEEDKISLDDLLEQSVGNDMMEPEPETENEFKKDDWNLLLVNKQHTIPEEYTFTLGTIKGSMQCDERIISPLTEMFSQAKKDGVNLIVCSPYRDIHRQEFLFNRKINHYLNQGYSFMDAYKTASITVTVPGASEHQVGLAVDIICDNYSALDEGFGNTEAGKWLKENSKNYGFILRYPQGKENITGIQYEPWHFRYVGKEAATIIMEQDITLEEFIESL